MTDTDSSHLTRRDLRHDAEALVPRTPSVLMVCTGNICRSPMAETMLRARLGSLDVRVHSAGTRALIGHPMPRPAQKAASVRGASKSDAAAHRARWLLGPMLEDADLVIGMSRRHLIASVEIAPQLRRQTFTAREFGRLSAGLTDERIRHAASAGGNDPRARLRAALMLVASQRGVIVAPPPEEYDVITPYKRTRRAYNAVAAQMAPAMDAVAHVLRAALA